MLLASVVFRYDFSLQQKSLSSIDPSNKHGFLNLRIDVVTHLFFNISSSAKHLS